MHAWRRSRSIGVDARTTDRTAAGEAAISILVDTLSMGLMAVLCTEISIALVIGDLVLRMDLFDDGMSDIRS